MPAVTLALTGTTATTATLAVGNLAADGTLELQLSARPDFQFCVSPVYTGLARATPYVASCLNQDARYYARMRSRRGSGAAEDWSNTLAFKTPVNVARDLSVPAVLMDPAIIMRPEPIMSWVTSQEVAGYPGKNVSRDAPVAWRSISVTGSYGIILEHSGTPIDTIAVLQTNIPESATMRIYAGDVAANVAAGTSPFYSGVLPFRASANVPGRLGHHGLARLPVAQGYRYIGVFIDVPAPYPPATMIHVEHIAIGLNRKSKSIALDKTEQAMNLGNRERTRIGLADTTPGLKMRRVEFDLAYLTETQSETLYHEMKDWLDETVLVVPNSKANAYLHDRILYGDLRTVRNQQPSSLHVTRTFAVESLI